VLFWFCWVTGFTFIQSFGQSVEVYFGWFSYYILTLPLFAGHTYLVAYVLIPLFLNRRLFPLFVILFLVIFYGFSVLELILSNEFIFRWFPTGTETGGSYLAPGNVIISGLGNLYIVLVFLATRVIREWYLADKKKKNLQQEELQRRIDDTMTRVQPSMLLYSIDHIERMVAHSSKNVTRAIALTSELLNEVMTCHGEAHQLFTKEIDLVKKLVLLVFLFRGEKPEVEFFLSGDPDHMHLPPMILFSFVGMLFRKFDKAETLPEIHIEASGFSKMITLQVLTNGNRGNTEYLEACMNSIRQLESYFGNRVSIICETHLYGCSVIIKQQGFSEDAAFRGKTFDPMSDAVHRV
jgi:two-component system LytT family sensor kinase